MQTTELAGETCPGRVADPLAPFAVDRHDVSMPVGGNQASAGPDSGRVRRLAGG